MFLVSGIFLKESLRYLLYSARSGKVKRLNILEDNSLKISTNFELNHGDCIIDMSVNGKYIFTGGSDGKLILWTYNELDSKHTRVENICFLSPLVLSKSVKISLHAF